MGFTRIEVEPLTNVLGAKVRGIDLREPLDDETVGELSAAWVEHKVLFLPDQVVDRDQHKRFALYFGEIYRHPYLKDVRSDQDVVKLYSGGDTGSRYVAEGWHTDVTFAPQPPMGSILHALEVPPYGGDTMWLDLEAAYAGLSAAMQEFAATLTAPAQCAARGVRRGRHERRGHHERASRHPHAQRERPQGAVRQPRFHAQDRRLAARRIRRVARDVPRALPAARVSGPHPLGTRHDRHVGQPLHAAQSRRRQPRRTAQNGTHHTPGRHPELDAAFIRGVGRGRCLRVRGGGGAGI